MTAHRQTRAAGRADSLHQKQGAPSIRPNTAAKSNTDPYSREGDDSPMLGRYFRGCSRGDAKGDVGARALSRRWMSPSLK
jgi:hypothetical protein